ncbi:alpha/beta hydrolase family protein [Luteirhabdus pelagi]|uniref:alpha/beta hydrolase family protein n=1 Tax=Luteirhabdus pelagi TaxID=2792783 RepID=UPI0019399027|nr:acyl-CoA thioester hydrolase/BAAT C-terminal domain-containing protein [Luteirhabdus pelagi]
MGKRFHPLYILLLLPFLVGAQTYIGELLYRDSFQYIKIEASDSLVSISMPYMDGRKSYPTSQRQLTRPFQIKRENRTWTFNLKEEENTLSGTISIGNMAQPIVFHKQASPIAAADLSKFEGIFRDENGTRTTVYKRNGYLHMLSPYSGRTMSLKPIAPNTFWTVSGCIWKYDAASLAYTRIDRNQNKIQLTKLGTIHVEGQWIPIQNDTLYAKLFFPPDTGSVPACLVLPGGGAVGMDNYEYEARFFAANGMLAMVFDKSGNGKSKGPGNFNRQTFEEKNDQYKALFQYLQQHPRSLKNKVGVHGPSEGGRLALMMASDLPEMAFVNATAAPIMTMREGQLYAVDHYHRALGVSEADNNAIAAIWNDYYEGIINDSIPPSVIDRANQFRGNQDRLFLPPNATGIPMSPSKEDLQNKRVVTDLKNIQCPILLQYGENDQRVDATASIRTFKEHVSPNIKTTILQYPRASHSFMTPEYEISYGYLDDKLAWLKEIGILK